MYIKIGSNGNLLRLFIFTILVTFLVLSLYHIPILVWAGSELQTDLPTIMDAELEAELIFEGEFEFEENDISPISSMAVLSSDDILLLEKNTGRVYRIINGEMLQEPLLDVSVANERERGLLGIAVATQENEPTHVYLYFTRSSNEKDGKDLCRMSNFGCKEPDYAEGNVVYRYELEEDDNALVNPQLIIKLPSLPGPVHNGGTMIFGPDDNLYIAIGDVGGSFAAKEFKTMAQNYQEGVNPDGRSGIIRIDPYDAAGAGNATIIGDDDPLGKYFAYGIRNSFGMDFDPVTGNLWDTENGPDCCDEINLVEPGFNSGWEEVQGIWKYNKTDRVTTSLVFSSNNTHLVDFNGQGEYSPPEFIWKDTVGPTALKFFNSDKYGKEYENDLFIGSSHGRSVYHFDLKENREELSLDGGLKERIADDRNELRAVTFAEGFDFITDIDLGLDGYLYVLSYNGNRARIVRIVPST
jgi:glucose/arabinose dehydrogenase